MEIRVERISKSTVGIHTSRGTTGEHPTFRIILRINRDVRRLVAPAGAQGAPSVPKLQFEKITLPNGLEVILHEDHSTPIVVVNTWYQVGSGDEKPGRTGFAHLFEHIMFMGSEHVPVGQFDKWLEAAGARQQRLDQHRPHELLRVNAVERAPPGALARCGSHGPSPAVMDQAKLDLQRDVVKNERRQRYDNVPYGSANETIVAALFPATHPYHWPVIGSMTDLSAASLEDVKEFFRTYYAPNNATLVIAGRLQSRLGDHLGEPVLRRHSAWPADAGAARRSRVHGPARHVPRAGRQGHAAASVQDVAFGKLFHPDDAPLDVLADVLAGDKNSRLYKRLVFDMQVAQDVSCVSTTARSSTATSRST